MSTPPPNDPGPRFGYLCVDEFLTTLLDARALLTAFQTGLIDHLRENRAFREEDLAGTHAMDPRGLTLLLDLLQANRVLERVGGDVRLTEPFRAALRYRDVLEAKLAFAHLVAADVLEHFTELVREPTRFMQHARLFELFDYARCLERTPDNLAATRRWVRITTALTRYEAEACLTMHSFGGYRRMLDVGGNSGEFALQACRRHRGLSATVFDLPVVCDIGEEHVREAPEAGRINFHRGDASRDEFPGGFDVITFKSMLHDWPDREARTFLERAAGALEAGGTVLIFERSPMAIGPERVPFAQLPMLLFQSFYRAASVYGEWMTAAGLRDVSVLSVTLEMPFMLVTGRKPG